MEMKRSKIIIILILMTISISLLVYSFAYTTTTHTSVDSSYLMISEISFGLNDSVESISLSDQIPTIDKFGVTNEAFSFSITNNGGSNEQYTLRLVDGESISTISNDEIRYQVTKNGVKEDIRTLSNSGIIDTGTMSKGATNEYSIVVWLNFDATTTSGTWNKVVKVEAGNVNIDNSGANAPILLDNMIPVYYDSDNDMWKKADHTNSNINYRWYDYDNRIWANSVTVYSDSLSGYADAPEGTEIMMDDITMFYVWIPRFKYELFENGSPKRINISFEKGIENTGTMKCSIKDGVETCNGEKISYTHPAFTFGDEELTGYWINKFELAYGKDSICYEEYKSGVCEWNDTEILSKPNHVSLKYGGLGYLFYGVRQMELEGNIYGFSNVGTILNDDGSIEGDLNDYDIHLSRNFETAALSYLTYSKYGKYTNTLYDENNKVVFDNNSNYRTGLSFVNNILYDYNVEYYGTGASTTGNIYGVYDLNGNNNDYVMMNMLDTDNQFSFYKNADPFFNSSPLDKYYDKYSYTYFSTSFISHYGDATVEFSGFTDNTSSYPGNSYNFIERKSVDSIEQSWGSYYACGRSVIAIKQDIYITKW